MIVIGVDSHKQSLAVCAVDPAGRSLAEESFANDPAGHQDLLTWARDLAGARRFAIEGTGSYAAALAHHLLAEAETVCEVPPQLTRRERRVTRRLGKSDAADAYAVALVAIRQPDLPPVRNDPAAEELKLLATYRDQVLAERTRLVNQTHADLLVLLPGYGNRIANLTAPTHRAQVRRLLRGRAGLRVWLIRQRLARIGSIDAQVARLDGQIAVRVRACCPSLLALPGVGPVTAAKIRGETSDVRRFRSKAAFAMACGAAPIPASSGQTQRHRLNRGGNRQLNRALYTIAFAQLKHDPRAQAYVARKKAEGKSLREALRCLKRHLANVVFRALHADLALSTNSTT